MISGVFKRLCGVLAHHEQLPIVLDISRAAIYTFSPWLDGKLDTKMITQPPQPKTKFLYTLWLSAEEGEIVFERAQRNGSHLFWRVRAKGEDSRIVYSSFGELVFEKLSLPKNKKRIKLHRKRIRHK